MDNEKQILEQLAAIRKEMVELKGRIVEIGVMVAKLVEAAHPDPLSRP